MAINFFSVERSIKTIYYIASMHSFRRIAQSDWSIWVPDFAVMPSAVVAGHYEIFNALQNKTEQNSEKH